MDLLDQMQTFVRIVSAGSLSAAARARGLSLAAVSRQLATLERELDATLVVRSTRRLNVTEAGTRWYEHCARLLREVEDAKADVSDRDDVRGTVVISAPITFGSYYAVPRIEALARANPRLHVDLRLEDHVIDLVGDGVDIAIRAGVAPPDSASVIAHPLMSFRRVCVAAPTYLRRRGKPEHPRELEQHDTLGQHGLAAAFTRWRFERADEALEVTPHPRLRASSPMVLRDWALAGAGIALLPEWAVGDDERALRVLLRDWHTPEIHAWALHRVEVRGAPRIRAATLALSATSR
jgi:DNA-binding transcriptional LysR family regulator